MPNRGRVKDTWMMRETRWIDPYCDSRFRGMRLEYRKMSGRKPGLFRFGGFGMVPDSWLRDWKGSFPDREVAQVDCPAARSIAPSCETHIIASHKIKNGHR